MSENVRLFDTVNGAVIWAIRARMKKTIGGDEHLDFSGQNIRAKEDH